MARYPRGVETAEEHTVVLTSRRMAPMSLEQILSLGIKPERKDILIVKGVIASGEKLVGLIDVAHVVEADPLAA